jgi:hypothetical protein
MASCNAAIFTLHRISQETNLNSSNKTDKKDCASTASLKDLMMAPPMTEKQHSALMHKRQERRRMLEAARELKAETDKNPW